MAKIKDMALEVLGLIHRSVKLNAVSPTARHRCGIFSEMCCPSGKLAHFTVKSRKLVVAFSLALATRDKKARLALVNNIYATLINNLSWAIPVSFLHRGVRKIFH